MLVDVLCLHYVSNPPDKKPTDHGCGTSGRATFCDTNGIIHFCHSTQFSNLILEKQVHWFVAHDNHYTDSDGPQEF